MSAFAIRNKFVFTIGLLILISGVVYSTTNKHDDIIILNLFLWGGLITWLGYKKTNDQVVNNHVSNTPIAKTPSLATAQPTIKFEKIQEIISHTDRFNGYLLIRTLKPNISISAFADPELIANVILSKYHFWSGERDPNGVTWNVTVDGREDAIIVKSYGFFDNTKIKPEHYEQLTFDDFSSRLVAAIVEETENDETFIKRAKNIINIGLNSCSTYYYLDLDEERNEDLVSEWHVYDFFYAFISIDRANNLITLIEFGLD